MQGGYPHGTEYEKTVNAWPLLKNIEKFIDKDKDGIPDDWEVKNKLNPADASDASKVSSHNFYTNIAIPPS